MQQSVSSQPTGVPDVSKRHKVLIVDDSRMVRASITKAIKSRFDYREEADGEAAWSALLHDPNIELVITDVGMPRLDGFSLLERIRSSDLSHIREMPVIILSGDETQAERLRAKKLGANDFITKGLDSVDIVGRIDGVFKLARLREDLMMQSVYRQTNLESETMHAREPEPVPVTPQMIDSMATVINLRAFMQGGNTASALEADPVKTAVVVAIDNFSLLETQYGQKITQLLHRKLEKILVSQIRPGETVEPLASGTVVLYSPNADLVGRCAFGLRVCRAIEKMVMAYGQDRVKITVSVGVAGVEGLDKTTRMHLRAVAQDRLLMAQTNGGNRVFGENGEVGTATLASLTHLPISVDRALILLRAGAYRNVLKNRAELETVLAPLLALLKEN